MARKAALLAMAKMALVDGHVSQDERAMLAPLLGPGDSVEALVEEASRTELASIVAQVDKYADRFFVALRAASMAMVDEQLDAREQALYQELVTALAISAEDQSLIDDSVAHLDALEPPPMHPRIELLYRSSSFVADER